MKKTAAWTSSQIRSGEYDPETQVLTIEFVKGATYEYYDVPEFVWIELNEAYSVGKTFARLVRGKYKYKKIFDNG